MFSFKKEKKGQQATLSIQGMHCVSCAMNIDGALEDMDGVYEASTNYAQQRAQVFYDPKKAGIEDIILEIEKMGYTAEARGEK